MAAQPAVIRAGDVVEHWLDVKRHGARWSADGDPLSRLYQRCHDDLWEEGDAKQVFDVVAARIRRSVGLAQVVLHPEVRPGVADALVAIALEVVAQAAPAEIVQLHDGPEVQHLAPEVAPVPLAPRQLTQERARREATRGNVPLPLGGLFDDVARAQLDLFA